MTTSRYCPVICSNIDAVRDTLIEIMKILKKHAWDEAECLYIRLALDEALTNAVKHGNEEDPGKCVKVACAVTDDDFTIQIEDEGEGFDPALVPDCTTDEGLELPSGRGLHLMRSFMGVTYNDRGNKVTLHKQRGVAVAYQRAS